MFRIALCDDDADVNSMLQKMISEFHQNQAANIDLSVVSYSNGLDLMQAIQSGIRFDVIFLDIYMPLATGIDIAREIRGFDTVAKLVFLTSTPEYALDSYDVKARAYLLKTSPSEKIMGLIKELFSESHLEYGPHIILKTKTGLTKLFLHCIEFIEVSGKNITIHMTDKDTFEVFGSLNELEMQFIDKDNFIKPHRAFLVNMDCIKKVHEKEIMTLSGASVPISKANIQEVKKKYLSYSFNQK